MQEEMNTERTEPAPLCLREEGPRVHRVHPPPGATRLPGISNTSLLQTT